MSGAFGGVGPFGPGSAAVPAASSTVAGTVRLGVDVPAKVTLAADVSDTTGSLVDTGLAFTPLAGKTYWVYFTATFTTAAATTGLRWTFTPPGVGAGTAGYSGQYAFVPAAATNAIVINNGPMANSPVGANTNATTNQYAAGEGLYQAGTTPAGDFKVQFNTEVGASAVTLLKGATLFYQLLD